MRMADAMLMEIEQEAQATRRLLERVPEDKLGWRPHEKSFSLGQLALHVAQLLGAVSSMAALDTMEVPEFQQPEATSRTEILESFDASLKTVRANLGAMDDDRLMGTWTLQEKGRVVMTVPRAGLLRSILLNHYYHHRGQLCVYLRLLDVPVPSVYGPTADENPFAAAPAGAVQASV